MGLNRNLGQLTEVIKEINGNVDIITELNVDGNTVITGSLNVTQGITGSLFGTTTSASFAATASFVNVSGLGGFVQGGNSFGTQALIGTNDNQSLALETSGSVRMFVSSSGNVGIGTATPEQKLQINGPLALSNLAEDFTTNQAYAYPIIYSSNLSGLGNGELIIQPRTTATRSIRFVTRNSGDVSSTNPDTRMMIRWDGNVGIGTTSPNSTLSITKSTDSGTGSTFPRIQVENTLATQGNGSSTFNFADIRIASGNDTVQMLLGTSFAAGVWEPQGSINVVGAHPLIIKTNNTERMRIFSSGNVFIGSSPTDAGYMLDVNGTGRFLGSLRIGNVDFGTNQVLSLAPGVFGIDAPGVGNGRFIVNGSGNVGIGITNPSTKLAVGGKASFFSSSNDYALTISNTDADGYGLYIAAGGTFPVIDTYSRTGTALFRVSGGGVLFAQNTSVQSISDIRTKENIRNSEDGLDIIMKLRPVRFDFKEEFKDAKNELGFIAQEVEEVFPDIVSEWENYQDEITYKTIGQGGLIPVLVKAIQELKAEIEILKNNK
jgi:hypothetical protein